MTSEVKGKVVCILNYETMKTYGEWRFSSTHS